jgi:serine/threonine-protein kinase
MDYVQGDSLSKLLRAAYAAGQRPIPLGVGLTMVADALYGLHSAHETKSEKGEPLVIVHRDVSPQNILVGVDGVARVVDFGIAKAASQAQTQSDVLKGKLAYMSPEQFRRAPVDRRADIFAASIVLWEVVSGRRLFAAEEPASVLHAVLFDEIAPPSALVPDLPPAVDAIVMKGLERDPDKRFATANEMAAAIEATGLLVRPADVGAWVEQTAGDVLRRRSERIGEIESDVSVPALPPPREAHAEPTMRLRDDEARTEVSSSVAPPRRRWPAVALVAALALVGTTIFAAGRLRSAPPAAPAASASAPPAPEEAAAAPVAVTPTVEATGSSAAPAPSPAPTKKAPRATKRDCSPPYYFDGEGVKRFKPWCL